MAEYHSKSYRGRMEDWRGIDDVYIECGRLTEVANIQGGKAESWRSKAMAADAQRKEWNETLREAIRDAEEWERRARAAGAPRRSSLPPARPQAINALMNQTPLEGPKSWGRALAEARAKIIAADEAALEENIGGPLLWEVLGQLSPYEKKRSKAKARLDFANLAVRAQQAAVSHWTEWHTWLNGEVTLYQTRAGEWMRYAEYWHTECDALWRELEEQKRRRASAAFEDQRRKEEEAARRAEEEAQRRERVRQEEANERKREEDRKRKQEQDQRERRGREEKKRMRDASTAYEARWQTFTSNPPTTFTTVPWPMSIAPRSVLDITTTAVRAFIWSDAHSPNVDRRQRVRLALLQWHPDKFEGRIRNVGDIDRSAIMEGVKRVASILVDMLAEG